MSKLIEILRTLQDDETVCFCKSTIPDSIKMTAFKSIDDCDRRKISRIISDDVVGSLIIDQIEAMELQDMLTKLRKHAEGKEQ